ncbi:hypothetical protein SLA2020_468020 [Shorea laevis]
MLSLMEVLLSSDGKRELNERKGFILRSLAILVGKWWLTGRLESLAFSIPLWGIGATPRSGDACGVVIAWAVMAD